MKTVDWRKATAVAIAFAAAAAAQTVWNGRWDDTISFGLNDAKPPASFTIRTPEQLAKLASLVNDGTLDTKGKTFTLAADIALNVLNTPTDYKNWGVTPPANSWKAIGNWNNPFQGEFDGAGFVVRGVYIETGDTLQGLFGYVKTERTTEKGAKVAAIRKLRVAESYIEAYKYVGGLAGMVDSGAITECYATGPTVVGADKYVGGLVGGIFKGTITNSYATGAVTGESYVGGLAGFGIADTIRGSYATGEVSGIDYVGGLVGSDSGYMLINSYAAGKVNGSGDYVGGLTGVNGGIIANSYALGNVDGRDYVGGLSGFSFAPIKNSYAAGKVSGSGDYAGYIVGVALDGAAITCGYYDRDAYGEGEDSEIALNTADAVIPKKSEDMRGEGFVDLLNMAAYGLSEKFKLSVNKWIHSAGGYPTLSGGAVTMPDLISCFAAGSGDGSKEITPIRIKTAQHLENLAVLVNCGAGLNGKYFKLVDNIFLNDTADWENWGGGDEPPANEWTAIGQGDTSFCGTFDGSGFVVGGIYVNRVNDTTYAGRYHGLFGRLGQGGTIKNLGVVGSYINAYCYVGGLAGLSTGGRIDKCYAKANVSADGGDKGAGGVGGLLGINDKIGEITNSFAAGNVSGVVNVAGGLVGCNTGNSKITSCYAAVNVSVVGDDVGGLVGKNDGSTIRNCYAEGDVSGIGGSGDVPETDEDGNVPETGADVPPEKIGGDAVGGLVGKNVGSSVDAVVTMCYAAGTVRGNSSVGGLAGLKLGKGRIDSCYYRVEASAVRNDYGIPKTDSEMGQKNTYVGWDFDKDRIWAIDPKVQSYPYLAKIERPNAVLSAARVIPEPSAGGGVYAAVSPVAASAAGFTAGPNPAAKFGVGIGFFRKGKRIADCELWVYDALGNAVNKVKIADRASSQSTRKVGSWDLTDAKGRKVPGGAYLVKGVVAADGKREKVSIPVGVK